MRLPSGVDGWDALVVVGLVLVAAGSYHLAEWLGFVVVGLECVGAGVKLPQMRSG